MANEVEAGRAYVEIFAKFDSLESALKTVHDKVEKTLNKIGDLGAKASKAGGAILAPFAIGAKNLADFTDQVARVGTMMDATERKEFLGKFSQQIKDASVEFGLGTDIVADGVFNLLSAGRSISQVLGQDLESSLQTSIAGQVDLGTVIKATTTLMSAYPDSIKDMTDASDFMFAVFQKGKTTIPEIASFLGNVAGIAGTAKVPINELGGALATMTQQLDLAKGVEALNAVIRAFLKPSQEAEKIAKGLGINLSAAQLQSKGLVESLKQFKGVDAGTLAKLFPDAGLKGISILLGQMKTLEANTAFTGERAGLTKDKFEVMASTLGQKLRKAGQQVKSVFVSLGETIEDDLDALSKFLGKGLAWTSNFISRNKELFQTLARVGAILLFIGATLISVSLAGKLILGVLGAIKTAVMIITSPVMLILGLMVGLSMVLLGILDTLGIMDTGFGKLLDSIRIMGTGLGTWIGAIIVGLAVIWEKIITGMANTFDRFVGTVVWLAGVIVDAFLWVGEQIAKIMRASTQVIVDGINLAIEGLNKIKPGSAIAKIENPSDKIVDFVKDIRAGLDLHITQFMDKTQDGIDERNKLSAETIKELNKKMSDMFVKDGFTNDGIIGFDSSKGKEGLDKILGNIKDLIENKLGIDLGFNEQSLKLPDFIDPQNPIVIPEQQANRLQATALDSETSALGTFTGSIAASLGSEGIFTKQLEETKKQTELLEKIASKEGGLG